ncbi:UNVERIFIED_CONTAM: hypothetical protein GTU68_050672 [Idotea baltica]|nr:hypothetical protein [Idotea baltica]
MYVCGPTVYSFVHMGNVRTFTSFDVIYRYLCYLGYKVRYVRNITDGEDKIAQKARLEQLEPMEVVQKYTNDFHNVMLQFNNIEPSIEPSATGHIIEQIEWVQTILEKGFAYEANGSVYFDVEKYNEDNPYGELSGRKIEDLISNTRELDGQSDKKSPLDFAIWKKAEPQHIMRWNSPWGEGFPGWHLECSVMSTKYLGEKFDIHGGGMDLKFPHHECEIAQAVACCGTSPVNYWMHTNMLTVNGTKMSKSLNNSFLPHELFSGDHPLLERGYSPMTVRFFFLMSHYSSQVDFSNEALQAAEKGLNRLSSAYQLLQKMDADGFTGSNDTEASKRIINSCETCHTKMCDDFNTPEMVAAMFDLSSVINSIENNQINKTDVDAETFNLLKTTFEGFLTEVMGIVVEEDCNDAGSEEAVNILMEVRGLLRTEKNYALSDLIRDKMADAGIEVKDKK